MKTPAKNLLLQLVNGVREPLMMIDVGSKHWRVSFFNAALLRLLGMQSGEVSQQEAEPILFRVGGSAAVDAVRRCADSDGLPQTSFESRYISASAPDRLIDGEVIQANGYRNLLIVYLRARDADDQLGETASLRQLDSTGSFLTRDPWLETLQRDAAIAAREQVWLAVILLRVDALDTYINTFGAHAGDSAMKRISHSIRRRLKRAGDSATRLGNDEFALVVHGSTAPAARDFANSIAADIKALAIHHPHSPKARHITVSVGVCAEVPAANASAGDQMLKRARTQLDRPGEPINIVGSLTAH